MSAKQRGFGSARATSARRAMAVVSALVGLLVWPAGCAEEQREDASRVDQVGSALGTSLSVSIRVETLETNVIKPRLKVSNTGSEAISDFTLELYFKVTEGRVPVLENYHTPESTEAIVDLSEAAPGLYRLEYRYLGKTLSPGATLPDSSGSVVGIRFADWSPWDRSDDFSVAGVPLNFVTTTNVPVVVGGQVIHGSRPPELSLCQPGDPALDDGNPCTEDTCDPVLGIQHTPLAAGTSCADDDVCNGDEACDAAGMCEAGTPLDPDDENPCTTDSCDPVAGVVNEPVVAGTSCEDGDVCNGDEACDGAGLCAAGTPLDPDDGNPCTADSCDPVAGVVNTPVAVGTSCGDGNVCNGAEACDGAGLCAAGTPLDPNDGNPCTADSCDPVAGVVNEPVVAGTSCGDGNVCNGAEACDGTGLCAAGTPLDPNDGNPCTADSCDPSLGIVNEPVAAGTSCADADVCNGAETCDGAGTCAAGTPLDPNDENPCTMDSCDPVAGVVNEPVAAGTSCADGDVCNGAEACDGAGTCAAGTPLDSDDGNVCTTDSCDPTEGVVNAPVAAGTSCADADVCNGGEVCDGAGACEAGTPLDPDDNNPCTADSCDPVAGVVNTPVAVGTGCGDGDVCNGDEACDGAGICATGTPLDPNDENPCTTDSCDPAAGIVNEAVAAGMSCADGDVCNGAEACDGAGTCAAGTPLDFDDNNPCTTDSCDPVTGVVNEAVAAGTSCEEGNLCNGDETCDGAGTCAAGTPLDSDDGNPCTVDACDPVLGVVNEPAEAGATCTDGDLCNGEELCDGSGACEPGVALDEDDGNPCTADSCDPFVGVVNTPAAPGTSCGDGDACKREETCDGTASCAAGTPLNADDGNVCTSDSCDPIAGVVNTPVAAGTSCADADLCNGDEACDGAGTCAAGTPLNPDDNNACTADSCDPILGVANDPVSAGTSCADGDVCNGDEACDGAGTCAAGTPLDYDDNNPCTTDSCDPVAGVVNEPAAAGVSCADENVCNGEELCDGAGACAGGTPLDPDDGNPCTVDACDPVAGVSNEPTEPGASCTDGDLCNGEELCDGAGACESGNALDEDDGNRAPSTPAIPSWAS